MTQSPLQYTHEQAEIRYKLDHYICQRCSKQATQQAHRIAQTKANLKKYGIEIIHHNYNRVSVCGLECNAAYNIGNNPGKVRKLVALIRDEGDIMIYSDIIDGLIS